MTKLILDQFNRSPAIVYFYLLFAGLGLLSLSAAGSIWVGGGIAAGRSESTDE